MSAQTLTQTTAQWNRPLPLASPRRTVETLTPEHLPEICRPFLEDIATRLQCPLEYAAAPFIVAFSSIVGRRLALRLHDHDDWLIVPNLWGAVVGPPGSMKSAAFARALAPLVDLENEWLDRYDQELHVYYHKRLLAQGKDRAFLDKPFCYRLTVSDAPVDVLARLLYENPDGLLLVRDDLGAWLHSMNGKKQHRARDLYLQAASGQGHLTCDRLTRDPIHVPAVCLSVFGGIDPASLHAFLDHSAGKTGAAALFQRMQILFWPDVEGQWQFADPPPTENGDESLRELFRQFAYRNAIPPDLSWDEKKNLPFVRLTPSAGELYRQWRQHLESELQNLNAPPALQAHHARFRSLMPSLALLLRILDRGVGDVDQPDFELALRWECVLLAHAQKVYDPAAHDSAPHILLDRLRDHRLHWESFAWEDLRRCHWAGLTRPGDLTRAMMTLLGTGHIRVSRTSASGRPLRYQLNPLAEPSDIR
jgi:putative DNA primase/helicase